MRLYVATSWRNERYEEVLAQLVAAGHDAYDFKNPPSGTGWFHWSSIDPNWKSWEPRQFRQALQSPLAVQGFDDDMGALEWCEGCVQVMPCGKSASLELGWACGAGKFTAVLLAPQEPELMLKMCPNLCATVEEVLAAIDRYETIVDFAMDSWNHKERMALLADARGSLV